MAYSPHQQIELARIMDQLQENPELPPHVNADHSAGAAMIQSTAGFSREDVDRYCRAVDFGEKPIRAAYRHLNVDPEFAQQTTSPTDRR